MSDLVSLFKTLVQIDNPSGEEDAIRAFIADALKEMGITDQSIDAAGNLFVRVPGNTTHHAPVIMLSAHMDSVPPCHGIIPIDGTQDGRAIIQSQGNTILGADDKSGIATILSVAAACAARNFQENVPLEFLFSTREEIGLLGARGFDHTQSKADFCYVLDGEGKLGEIFHEASSQENLQIQIMGKRSHAGIAPEEGINAIQLAAEICAQVPIGRVSPKTTTNLGLINGGEAMNVVASSLELKGEARSQCEEELSVLLASYRKACHETESRHPGSQIQFNTQRRYDRFVVNATAPVVRRVQAACKQLNIPDALKPMSIGSDAHVLNQHGIDTVVLGMGFHFSHSLGEFIYVDEFEQVLQLVCQLVSQKLDADIINHKGGIHETTF
jgi:tripeptide aminopeptidase